MLLLDYGLIIVLFGPGNISSGQETDYIFIISD